MTAGTRRPFRIVATALLLVTAAASLGGCGSGSSSSPQAATANSGSGGSSPASASKRPDTGQAKDVLNRWLAAYDTGDGATACGLQTADYTKGAIAAGVKQGLWKAGIPCPDAVKSASVLIKAFGGSGTSTATLVGANGDTATFKVTSTKPNQGPDYYDLINSNGTWLISADAETPGSYAAKASKASDKAVAARWVSNWCRLHPGQTRPQTTALMGPPTSTFSASSGATPQYNWAKGPYSFTAFFDPSGQVKNFYANYTKLGKADLAKLPCSKTRSQN